jgi:hypothetical protein
MISPLGSLARACAPLTATSRVLPLEPIALTGDLPYNAALLGLRDGQDPVALRHLRVVKQPRAHFTPRRLASASVASTRVTVSCSASESLADLR